MSEETYSYEHTFKITYVSDGNKESFYFKHFVDKVNPSLSHLKQKLFPKYGVTDFNLYKNYKIYWIDEDGDEISIIDDDDLRILAARHNYKSTPIKLNVRSVVEETAENATKSAKTQCDSANTAEPKDDEALPVHPGVICDACDNGIYGFRYKCVQCLDYDLCRRCEGKMIHNHHMMVRIPIGVEKLPRKIDRVLNLGRAFENAEETVRKCRKDEAMFRREEEKHRREEDKHRRHEEKCKRKASRRCAREQHRASAPPSGDPESQRCGEGQSRPGHGIFYSVMDYLNYMMNPDNIMENLHQASGSASAPQQQRGGCPAMNLGFPIPPSCPRFQTDKAQEAKEKAAISPEAATAAADFESFLKSSVANAVPLGTDANVMTTSIGVAAKEVEVEKEKPQQVEQPKEEEAAKPVNPFENLQEKLNEKLNEMEREIENDRKNRSSSPTISYASEDSDEMNAHAREWTVLDNEETEGAASDLNKDTGAVPKEVKQVEDKATLTDNASSTSSSMFNSAHGNGNGEEKKPAAVPLTFAEMGKQLKAHIEEYRNLAVPVGPPAFVGPLPSQINPQATEFIPGKYPHPYSAAPKPKVYHSKPHINSAIHTMQAMGFSNDGGWLTNLLETVDGDISRALDLLQPHQK